MASRLRSALYCAIRIHSIKMCNTADIIKIIIIIISNVPRGSTVTLQRIPSQTILIINRAIRNVEKVFENLKDTKRSSC